MLESPVQTVSNSNSHYHAYEGQISTGTSLTMDPKSVFIGDPPVGVPFPGTTWIPGGNPHITTTPWTPGGWPGDGTGDFPSPYSPYPLGPTIVPGPTIIPIPQRLYPADVMPYPLVPGLREWDSTVTFVTAPNPWRADRTADRITVSIDMPGVRMDDLAVEIENNTVKVTAKRFDTGVSSQPQYFIGTDYDPKTAEATLEAGVLSVVVMRFKEKNVHQVLVIVK